MTLIIIILALLIPLAYFAGRKQGRLNPHKPKTIKVPVVALRPGDVFKCPNDGLRLAVSGETKKSQNAWPSTQIPVQLMSNGAEYQVTYTNDKIVEVEA